MGERVYLPLGKGTVWYEPSFLSTVESALLWQELETSIPWKQEPIVLFGKEFMQPRLTCWAGLPEAKIRYSGIVMNPEPFTPLLDQLRLRLNEELQTNFNGALLNYYRDGKDSMGWHSDNEAYQGKNPTIASISLGAARRFDLKAKGDTGEKPTSIFLEHGSMLVMAGTTQDNYKHQVPKTKTAMGARINITFRRILY
jgi:alkylated DNA repair dioxygenase AlkB